MTIKKDDRKELVGVVAEALEQVVLPRLSALEDGQQELKTDIADLRRDHGEHLDRIEGKLDATIHLVDNHDRRISRLERHAGLKG